MGLTHAQFVFGANHAFRNLAADFAFFDGQALFGAAGIQRAADGGDGYFLAYGDIGGAADDFKGLLATDGNGGTVEAIRIGVFNDRQHFAYDYAAKAAGNGVYFVNFFNFQTGGGEEFGHACSANGYR